MTVQEAINHYEYGITHDIFSEPVTTYAKMAVEALRKLCVYEEVRFERDIAIQQLEEIGVSFGQKMNDVKEALGKQIPKKPNFEQKGLLGVKVWHCPVCNKEIISDW